MATTPSSNDRQSRLSSVAVFAFLASAVMLPACSIFPPPPADSIAADYPDRCYIEDEDFLAVDRLYARLGTLQLVERHLRTVDQWRSCQVQEALYRLRKVHGLP